MNDSFICCFHQNHDIMSFSTEQLVIMSFPQILCHSLANHELLLSWDPKRTRDKPQEPRDRISCSLEHNLVFHTAKCFCCPKVSKKVRKSRGETDIDLNRVQFKFLPFDRLFLLEIDIFNILI
jgi:hypothetical protein